MFVSDQNRRHPDLLLPNIFSMRRTRVASRTFIPAATKEDAAMSTEHDIKTLNALIETVIDSADGYSEAAKASETSRFTPIFFRRGAERKDLTAQLQGEVRALGGEPEKDGTLLGSAHRMFLNLRNSMSSDDVAIVDQVEDGEDHIKHKFEDAIRDNEISPAVKAIIERAYTVVKDGHDEIRDLKHSLHDK
jgi:uncharacterized protein (TIGR02284 family)